MKKAIALLAIAASMVCGSVMAYDFGGGRDDGMSQDQSQRQSQTDFNFNDSYARSNSRSKSGSNADNAMNLSQTYEQADDIKIRNTPSVVAPDLTTSNGTCHGSSRAVIGFNMER